MAGFWSVLITSNLVFSKWDQIFKDPMTTAAAIDRVVHHAVILELDVAATGRKPPENDSTRTQIRSVSSLSASSRPRRPTSRSRTTVSMNAVANSGAAYRSV